MKAAAQTEPFRVRDLQPLGLQVFDAAPVLVEELGLAIQVLLVLADFRGL